MNDLICADCKHFDGSYCDSPNNGKDLVTGKTKRISAIFARSFETGCGTEGKFFEQKPQFKWWRFGKKK